MMVNRQKLTSFWKPGALEHSAFKKHLPAVWVWSLLAGCLLLLGQGLHSSAILERMELSLLDFRLKARSETLTPSEQILVAAMDRYSQDEARNHPELGIYSRVLPRKELAGIIDYLSRQGAKAIVLDLSFEAPQSPEDDRALVDAIRRAGNVYVAASMELPLSEYEARQQSRSSESARLDTVMAWHNYRLMPYLKRLVGVTQWFPAGGCMVGFEQSGLIGLSEFSNLLPIPDTFLRQVWNHQCLAQANLAATMQASPSALPIQPNVLHSINNSLPPTTENPVNEFYRHQCLSQMYQQVFSRNPGYLNLLAEKSSPVITQGNIDNSSPAYCLTSNMLEPVLQASRGLGLTSVDYDKDSIFREVPLFYQGYLGKVYAYLGLRPVLDLLKDPLLLSAGGVQWGTRPIPFMEDGKIIVNWRSPKRLVSALAQANPQFAASLQPDGVSPEQGNRALAYGHLYRNISAIDVIKAVHAGSQGVSTPSLYRVYNQPQSGPLSLKDKIVVYGDAIEDVHRTPVSSRLYGPEIVATALDMLWHDRVFIQKVPGGWVWLITILVGAALFYAQMAFPRLWLGFLTGLSLIGLFWILNGFVFIQQGFWFPLVLPSLFLLCNLVGGLLYRYMVHDREKRQLTHIFARYVSPQVMQEIVSNPEASMQSLAGAEKNLTVLFADLKGFTERFTTEDPQRMVAQLNEYFTAMTRIILEHQGTYDKYIGDAVMAFFGAPSDLPDHAVKACAAALEMQKALDTLNEKWRKAGIPPLSMGIGLSSGNMIVGNFGSEDLQNYTVMGNAVNLGSRLESLTRKVDATIVISENTAEQAKGAFQVRPLGEHEIKGYHQPVTVFALDATAAAECV